MQEQRQSSNLPAQVADAIAGVPKALVPSSIKALDRLVGAAVDIPVAWLAQKKAKIDAQTQAYTLVEASIAKGVADEAGADQETVQRALNILVRKQYRKQINREAVAEAMIEDLASPEKQQNENITAPPPDLDTDWLNVFERYAEDASTVRMQNLWGRVLAGEIRKPGRYSMRTLRFLSEFSQADALTFSEFCNSVFGDIAPNTLVKPDEIKDIRNLIFLESAGLIQGASGFGLAHTLTFNATGNAFLREGSLVLMLQGKSGATVETACCVLTPLGQELVTLLPTRESRKAAREVALAMRAPQIESAYLMKVVGDDGKLLPMEVLWQKEQQTVPN